MTPLYSPQWQITPGAAQSDACAPLNEKGELRLVFLTERMARVTWKPAQGYREPRTWAIAPMTAPVAGNDVPWQGRERDDLSGFTRPALTVNSEKNSENHSASRISSGRIQAVLHSGNGSALRIEWLCAKSNQVLQSDRITSSYLHEKRTGLVRHSLQRDPREHYFGLGDKTGPLNLHGRRLRCLGQDSIGYDPVKGDPLYKHWPFLLTRTVHGQWTGIYYDTLASCTFDLGCEHDNYHGLFRSVDIDDGDLDYYFMVGDTPAEVIAQFVQLIGGTALPPRWTLGYAQTAMGLADAPDAQQQLDKFIDKCVEHRMPISAFHYGSGYSSRGKQRYVFTWNTSKFPDPQAVNKKFHDAGMRLVANLKPCLLDDHPAYEKLAQESAFINHASSNQPVVEPFWDGQGSHLDFTKPQAVAWWQSQLKAQILDKGIEVGWNDNNEYAIAAEDAVSHAGGSNLPIHRSRPLHALLMTRATYEAQKAAGSEQNDSNFTITRAGPPGIQRYAQTWSGDNSTNWENLKWNIRTGLQMSLSGMFNIGHDVGGFFGPVPDAELLLRWVQACALNPRMVMNSWKAGNVTNLPWMHPEVTDAVREALNLRYRLLPYLWRCFENASKNHMPIIRPTFYNFPEDENCLQDSDDFMLGECLLVAPVVSQGARTRKVYLPQLKAAEQWFDFYTQQAFAAGAWHEVQAPLEKLPLFARQGAKIEVSAPEKGKPAAWNDPIAEILEF